MQNNMNGLADFLRRLRNDELLSIHIREEADLRLRYIEEVFPETAGPPLAPLDIPTCGVVLYNSGTVDIHDSPATASGRDLRGVLMPADPADKMSRGVAQLIGTRAPSTGVARDEENFTLYDAREESDIFTAREEDHVLGTRRRQPLGSNEVKARSAATILT